MLRHTLAAGLLAGLAVPATLGAQAPRDLTLAAALAEAEARHPELLARAAAVEEARGRLLTARTYPYNPVVELEGADRAGPEGSSTDRGIAVSQVIELGGRRATRIDAARAELAAAEALLVRGRREVLAAAERTFAATVRGRELMAIAQADVELTANLLSLEERRLEAGAGTQIEVNLARAAAGRAVRRLQEATAGWREARARLAEATGLDPSAPPPVSGAQPSAPASLPPLDQLVRRAAEGRSDLAALALDRERAEAGLRLERSRAIPDLALGAFAAREEGDDLIGLRAGISLPLFDRNRGSIASASAAVDRVSAEGAAAALVVRREVAAAYGRYQAAAEALTALDALVVETLAESLDLLRRAVDAGELSATEVLLLRRELIDARRERIEAADEAWLARIDLELAIGAGLTSNAGEETRDES